MLPRGKPWPEPLVCMSDAAAAMTTDVIVNRREARSSTVTPDLEPSLWYVHTVHHSPFGCLAWHTSSLFYSQRLSCVCTRR